ncbi:MAG: alpha/beta hydrolase [Bacteroidia bacterium]|nr:alpha/beta hydrolase [Bacteroidia bacterium]
MTWYKDNKELKVGELTINYKESGQGPALICLHGFPTAALDFEYIWPQLTGSFHAFAYDFIGMGKSAKPFSDITVGMQADMAEALLVHYGIQEAHILAHDLGDTVALELLARQKDGKSKVKWLSSILLNGGLFPEVHQPRFIQKLLLTPLGPLVANFISSATYSRNMNNIFAPKYPPSEKFLKESWEVLVENNGKKMIPRLIKYMPERKRHRERWVGALTHAEIPRRFINGALDPVSGKHMAERYKELIPDPDVFILDDVGHYPHVETPERVLDGMAEFYLKHFSISL